MATLGNSTNTEIIKSFENNCNFAEISDSFAINNKNNSLIEESIESIDGLQWCTELDYQYKSDQTSSDCHSVPKSIFEASILGSSNSYTTPPTSNYTDVSNTLDANLAEIDIETFKSEDINAIFLQQAGEECASLSKSMFDDSISLESYRSLNSTEEPIDGSKSKNSINLEKTNEKRVLNDISVDSLDMSLFEKNTSKLLMKCNERDKNNYTIAFEGSITASQELNGLDRRGFTHSFRSGFLGSNYFVNDVNDKQMAKSEVMVSSLQRNRFNDGIDRNLNSKTDRLVQKIDKNIAKLTQSIPDIKSLSKMNREYKIPYCPVSGFIPLYDLQNSQSSNSHSSSSEFSPPRSLVKMFMQNRSPLSSEQNSPSLSYECHSPESGSGNTCDAFGLRPIYYNILDLNRETNNNVFENKTSRFGSNEEQINGFDDNFGRNYMRIESQRLQTFPIKEVDENMSDSSYNDIDMSDTNEINANICDLNTNSFNSLTSNQKPNNNTKETHFSTKSSDKYSFCSLNSNSFQNNSNTNRLGKGFNTSSGVKTTNGGHKQRYEPHIHSSTTNSRLIGSQSRSQDKEIQVSIAPEEPFMYSHRPNSYQPPTTRPVITPESPNDSNKPFYVYYPNYSLPDLSFLEQILEEHSTSVPKTVYISPTKHQMPNKESVSVKMRSTSRSKRRPKSLNDFESLSKQNFSHIKDWDSLNILLPNEFKELFQKANNVSNNVTNNVLNEMNCETKNTNAFNDYNLKPNPNAVRMRSHRSNGQLSNNTSRMGFMRNKRYSLQEYPTTQFGEPQNWCNISHEMPASCVPSMPRSVTMPNCHNSCHCHQHCCHNCCHSCCRTPKLLSPSTEKSFGQTSSADVNTSSIDKLCQILAMDLSFKRLMNIINGQNISQNIESNVENEKQFNIKSENNFYKQTDGSTEDTEDGLQFKQLKQRWESLATVSPTDTKPSTNNSIPGLNKNISNNVLKSKTKPMNSTKSDVKPEIPRKPKVVLRRPLSAIPRPTSLNTETPMNSQRKSMIPVPKTAKSPVNYSTKFKSNIMKPLKP